MKAFILIISIFMFAYTTNASERLYIKNIKIKGLHLCSQKELLFLLGIDKESSIDKKELSKGVKRAFRKEIFEDIILDYDYNKSLMEVIIKERTFIKKIKIKGNVKLSDSYIKRGLIFKEGDIFRKELLIKAEDKLKKYLKLSGFPNANVKIYIIPSEKSYLELIVNIIEGNPAIIKSILLPRWLKNKIDIQKGDIFNIKEIEKTLIKLRKYLFSIGYYNATVGPVVFHKGILEIPVSVGNKYEIIFKGNHALSSFFLKKRLKAFIETSFFEDTDIKNIVEFFVQKLKDIYKKKGFIFVQIAPVIQKYKVHMKKVKIVFFISEGKKVLVKKISFINTTISEKKLKEVMILKENEVFNPDVLVTDKKNILSLYRGLGYLDMKIIKLKKEIEENKVYITFVIEEGKRYKIKDIFVKGNKYFSKDKIIKTFKRNKTTYWYNEIDIFDGRKRVLKLYRKNGFLDADLKIKTETIENNIKIYINICEGKQYKFGKTIIKGNIHTSSEVILRELNYSEGDILNIELLSKLTNKLYQTGLFKSINITLINSDNHQSKKDVMIELVEANRGIVEFSVGYSEYEHFRTAVSLSYKNLWGMNRKTKLKFELSGIKKRLIFNYTEPYFSDLNFILRGNLIAEKRAERNVDTGEIRYKIKKYTANLMLEKKIKENLQATFTYEFSVMKTYDIKKDIILSEKDKGYLSISSITPAILYDIRDNPFNPHNGLLVGASVKLASTAFAGETDFLKLNLFGNIYKAISNRVVIALSIKGGIAQGYGNTEHLPIVERFFLGGRNSVRGFSQDSLGPKGEDGTPIGGNAFFQGNAEIRTEIGKGFGIVFFIDSGEVWKKIKDIGMPLRYTAGIGIRYFTPVGPLRIDYGHKIDKKEHETAGEFHFSIGHAF